MKLNIKCSVKAFSIIFFFFINHLSYFYRYLLKYFSGFFCRYLITFSEVHFRPSVVKQPYNSFISTAVTVLIFRITVKILYFAQKRVIKSRWKIVCAKSSKRINKTIKNNPGFVGVISFL